MLERVNTDFESSMPHLKLAEVKAAEETRGGCDDLSWRMFWHEVQILDTANIGQLRRRQKVEGRD